MKRQSAGLPLIHTAWRHFVCYHHHFICQYLVVNNWQQNNENAAAAAKIKICLASVMFCFLQLGLTM